MMKQLLKIAGIGALSAAAVTGLSLNASNALAAEDDENTAVNAETESVDVDNESIDADSESATAEEGTTAESSEEIYRRWYPYHGYYGPGYRFYRPPLYYGYGPGYRYYPPPFYYRHPRVCGPYGCYYGW
jgi:hypothetical protein